MGNYYTKEQTDAQAAVIGQRLKTATNPVTLATAIDGVADRNLITDEEREKLARLEGSRFLGTFTAVENIPTVNAGAGSYADVDPHGEPGAPVQRYIWDIDAAEFVASTASIAGETSASIKLKYEDNADTNPFTDAQRDKLAALIEATDITDFTAALDAALA